jgi:hypothetical protein
MSQAVILLELWRQTIIIIASEGSDLPQGEGGRGEGGESCDGLDAV